MNKYESKALGEHLTEWPDNMSYSEVLEGLRQENEDIIIWQPLEDLPIKDLIESIESSKWLLERDFSL